MTVDSKEMPSAMADLMAMVERDIPEGRQNLRDSFANLEKVADYCESNYFQAENKKAALEETKNYTTQSLASVAYQINTLAYNLLHMLDLQATQMADMESQINHISQTVQIHKEKVARREIGILTTNKVNPRQHKILVPAVPERPVKYIRKPIDYSLLDDIGHGVKIPQQQQGVRMSTGKRGSLTGINGASGLLPAPTTKPPTPPQPGRSQYSTGSISRGSKEYRTPAPPIAPPQVPSNYAPNYPLGHPRAQDSMGTLSRRGSNYSTLPLNYNSQSSIQRQMSSGSGTYGTLVGHSSQSHYNQGPQTPPTIGMVHPMAQQQNGPHSQQQFNAAPTPPPPPPPGDMHSHQANRGQQHQPQGMLPPSVSNLSDASLPEPPAHLRASNSIQDSFDRSSPPLPPPPPGVEDASSMPTGSVPSDNDWIPKRYLEKVIAIYDYQAQRYDELSFQENCVIYVIKKNDDGWYEGVLNGITGLFPGNYVEPCM
jgi:hypothetical protein